MKRILILLLVSTAHADTWIRYAHTASGVTSEYNHTRITHHDNKGRTFVVWTRTQETETRYELHCASESYRITDQTRQDHGEVIWQLTDPEATWHYAQPEGNEMALLDTICTSYE